MHDDLENEVIKGQTQNVFIDANKQDENNSDRINEKDKMNQASNSVNIDDYEEDSNNELNNEKERHKTCFKTEKLNMFTSKNTISLAILTNIELNCKTNKER